MDKMHLFRKNDVILLPSNQPIEVKRSIIRIYIVQLWHKLVFL